MTSVLLALPIFLTAIAALWAGQRLLGSSSNARLAPAAFVIGAFLFVTSGVLPVLAVRERGLEEEAKSNCAKDCHDLADALGHIPDKTLQGLARVNFQQLRTFTAIAQRQARMSYYASLAAAAGALLVLTSGAAVVVGLSTTPAKVAATTLTAAGAALSGFLTKTFLRTYEMASRQMSYYYGQPLVHCYLLHAEWLTREAHDWETRGVDPHLLKKVIDASIKAGFRAQNHLLTLQTPIRVTRGAGPVRVTSGAGPAGQQNAAPLPNRANPG